jgi:shikimate kinase
MNSNIVLIGFMGCGKSSIGRRLAARLGYSLLDSDELIIAAAGGKSISDLFAEEGEDNFRERETAELRKLVGNRSIILATGGGAVLKPENQVLLRNIGRVVWLHADPETLFERATRSRKRPLLEVENPRSTFNALLESRLPVYGAIAEVQVNATGLSHEQTVEEIVRILGEEGNSATEPPAVSV